MNEKLKALIDEAGISQAAFSKIIGVSEATGSRIFSGGRELDVNEAAILVEELRRRLGRKRGISLSELFGMAARSEA